MADNNTITEIKTVLEGTLNRSVDFAPSTHLIESGILDSLDSISFLFELENKTGTSIPDSVIADGQIWTVEKLADYIDENRSG
jgi:acyl carrier protein